MKNKFYLLVVAAVIACGVVYVSISQKNASSENLQKIASSNAHETNDKNEIIIDDRDFAGKSTLINTLDKNNSEQLKIKADGSQITTMFDGYGNKTETRFFSNNNRLKCIVMRTSPNGQKQIFVYGQNGEIKTLPANLIDRALTASANEIADSTGIYQTFKGINTPVTPQKVQPVETTPNNNATIQNPPVEAPVLPENQVTTKPAQPAIAPEKSKPETEPKVNVEKITPDKNLNTFKTIQSSN